MTHVPTIVRAYIYITPVLQKGATSLSNIQWVVRFLQNRSDIYTRVHVRKKYSTGFNSNSSEDDLTRYPFEAVCESIEPRNNGSFSPIKL